jgi:hypothetical protein
MDASSPSAPPRSRYIHIKSSAMAHAIALDSLTKAAGAPGEGDGLNEGDMNHYCEVCLSHDVIMQSKLDYSRFRTLLITVHERISTQF